MKWNVCLLVCFGNALCNNPGIVLSCTVMILIFVCVAIHIHNGSHSHVVSFCNMQLEICNCCLRTWHFVQNIGARLEIAYCPILKGEVD